MCKFGNSSQEQVEAKAKRLDARGNDVKAVTRESKWATQVMKSPGKETAELLHKHLAHLCDYETGKDDHPFTVEMVKLGDGWEDDPFALMKVIASDSAGFKKLTDNMGSKLKREDPHLRQLADKVRDAPFFKDRGRGPAIRQRRGSFSNPHTGIATSTHRDKSLEGHFEGPVKHGKGMFDHETGSETWKKFQESGAPFVGGASGTLTFLVLDLEKQKKREDLNDKELTDREKLLGIYTASLVAGGHHSVPECLLTLREMGYFTDVPDPLTDYDGALEAFEKHLGDKGLAVDKPLSKNTEDTGKTAAQIAYEKALDDANALLDRFRTQLKPIAVEVYDGRINQAGTYAVEGNYAEATKRVGLAKQYLQTTIDVVLRDKSGSPRLLDTATLIRDMGGGPKANAKILWVTKEHSTAYKAVIAKLDAYHKSYKELMGGKVGEDLAMRHFEELIGQLDGVISGANDYLTKHGGSTKDAKKNRCAVMQRVITEATAEKRRLDELRRADEVFAVGDDITLLEALEYHSFGIDPSTLAKPVELSEKRLRRDDCKMDFGSGAVNTVAKLVYDKVPPPGTITKIFKGEPRSEQLKPAPREIGLDGDKPAYGKRNIATRKVCETMGLGDLAPKCDFTTLGGKVGLAMDMAKGKTAMGKKYIDPGPVKDGKTRWEDVSETNRKNYGVVLKDGQWKKEVKAMSRLPFTNPPEQVAELQQKLIGLQWLDGLCGQVDRHAENYLVHVDEGGHVQVTGIDNDFSFGKLHKGVETIDRKGVSPDSPPMGLGRQFGGFPPLIDRALYDRIKDMEWDDYKQSISGLITAEELAASKGRFEEMKAHAKKLHPDRVVDNWQTFRLRVTVAEEEQVLTATEVLMSSDKMNYFQRERQMYETHSARDGLAD